MRLVILSDQLQFVGAIYAGDSPLADAFFNAGGKQCLKLLHQFVTETRRVIDNRHVIPAPVNQHIQNYLQISIYTCAEMNFEFNSPHVY